MSQRSRTEAATVYSGDSDEEQQEEEEAGEEEMRI